MAAMWQAAQRMGTPSSQEPPRVTARHLDAAQYLYDRLPEWNQTDAAFAALRDALPGFSLRDTFLKVAAVVGLYGIQRLYAPAMAVKLAQTLKRIDTSQITAVVVENEIAPLEINDKEIHHRSFASKFAHFFLPPAHGDRVPVYDEHSTRLVALHSGRTVARTRRNYVEFVEAHTELRGRNGLTCTNKQLDQYLWLAGIFGKSRPGPVELKYEELTQLLARDADAQRSRDIILDN